MAMTGSTKQLEYRMYFFVPYNISPIQQAIQGGHAALEYAWLLHNSEEFKNFIPHKTWIILNGGTTNDVRDADGVPLGTLNQIRNELMQHRILATEFYEPDLNNALTAICFICDERVFNYEDYPDFQDWIGGEDVPATIEDEEEWVKFIGGEKNLFLRELIRGKKLA